MVLAKYGHSEQAFYLGFSREPTPRYFEIRPASAQKLKIDISNPGRSINRAPDTKHLVAKTSQQRLFPEHTHETRAEFKSIEAL